MSEAKKFYLLDASQVKLPETKSSENTTSTVERTKPIKKREGENLDSIMYNIANDSSLTDDQKVDKYNQALTAFQSYKKTIPQKQLVTPHPADRDMQTSQRPDEYDPMITIGKTFQGKAQKVLKLLQKDGKFGVSNKGELIVNGQTLPMTNISDLLHASVNKKAYSDELTGMREFQDLLTQANVPKSLIYIPSSPNNVTPRREDPLSPKPSSPWQATPQQEYYTPQAKTVRKRYKTGRVMKWESHLNEKHGEPKKSKAV